MSSTPNETAAKDFYLDDTACAAYFEKDWFDHVLQTGHARPSRFEFAAFEMKDLYSPYHERLVEFIAAELAKVPIKPLRVLEIGSSTGRTFYEICRRIDSVKQATLVEPSKNLFDVFSKIMDPKIDVDYFPVLKGHAQLVEVAMSTSAIKKACASVEVQVLNLPFEQLTPDLGQFDLVICSNVIDQCHEPLKLVELLKKSTAPGGMIALSCTYQWQPKYRGLPAKPIRHLDELFTEDWSVRNETQIPFQLRVNERHWMAFLSHVCLLSCRLGA